MMSSHDGDPRRRGRIFVYRFSWGRSGWLAKLLVLGALIALIPLALLLVVGLWAVLAIGAAVVATAALFGAPLARRLRGTPPSQVPSRDSSDARILEGEARRIDIAD
jgi:hypothetical protein